MSSQDAALAALLVVIVFILGAIYIGGLLLFITQEMLMNLLKKCWNWIASFWHSDTKPVAAFEAPQPRYRVDVWYDGKVHLVYCASCNKHHHMSMTVCPTCFYYSIMVPSKPLVKKNCREVYLCKACANN